MAGCTEVVGDNESEGSSGTDPVAANIRPQLASSPYNAVFTSAEVEMRDAMLCASRYVGAPCTTWLANSPFRVESMESHLNGNSNEFGGTFTIANNQFCQILSEERQLFPKDFICCSVILLVDDLSFVW